MASLDIGTSKRRSSEKALGVEPAPDPPQDASRAGAGDDHAVFGRIVTGLLVLMAMVAIVAGGLAWWLDSQLAARPESAATVLLVDGPRTDVEITEVGRTVRLPIWADGSDLLIGEHLDVQLVSQPWDAARLAGDSRLTSLGI